MYQLIFYVPDTHLERVKAAVFSAGAGRLGDYDSCCWQTLGQGQFRPLGASQPFIGEHNTTEFVSEYRVEMIVAGEFIDEVIAALKTAHPYEMPAYHAIELADL